MGLEGWRRRSIWPPAPAVQLERSCPLACRASHAPNPAFSSPLLVPTLLHPVAAATILSVVMKHAAPVHQASVARDAVKALHAQGPAALVAPLLSPKPGAAAVATNAAATAGEQALASLSVALPSTLHAMAAAVEQHPGGQAVASAGGL